ncbi:MAG: M23 family peptidase, partial [Flavobacterium micromati]|nr:M23 family peptidase [Flavobacterium micromati]
MKQILIVIIALFSLGSCEKAKEIKEKKIVKIVPKKVEFGFVLSDFNVVQDTIKKGDTFGTIIDEQSIGNRRIYDITATIKDSFNVRSIRYNKPFTLLRSKNKKHDLQVFIYQPDALNYYVVDFRDSLVKAYKKTKPLTIKRRTIGGVLKES